MSHLSDIGFAVDDNEALCHLLDKAYKLANTVKAEEGKYFHYADSSGAEMWIHFDKNNTLSGVNPHFCGRSRQTVGLNQLITISDNRLEGAFYGWAAPSDNGEGLYPFVFEVPNINSLGQVILPQTLDIQLTAFAEEIFYCGDEIGFSKAKIQDDSQDQDIGWAVKSFVPTGLFNGNGSENSSTENKQISGNASAMLSGVIKQVEKKDNQLTGQAFYWLLVETFGGQIDVVADTQLFTELPLVDNVIHGNFWLSGQILATPQITPKKKVGIFQRLFGKS